MNNRILARAVASGLAALALAQPATADLLRAGPTTAATGEFPAWYQDSNGLALELCVPFGQDNIAAGGCLIAPPPGGTIPLPETFPGQWQLEHFYYHVSAPNLPFGMIIEEALESTFNTPAPAAGQQITFQRYRAKSPAAACPNQTYFVYSPHRGKVQVTSDARGVIAYTEDLGISPLFTGALTGPIGPFLQRSSTAGGVPLAPVRPFADGLQYLSAGDIGFVTGSVKANPFQVTGPAYTAQLRGVVGMNYFGIEGPGVSSGNCASLSEGFFTTQAKLVGRLNTPAVHPIANRTTVDRAAYSYNTTTGRFQIGTWANAFQEVNQTTPPIMAISLNAGDAAVGTPEVAMVSQPSAAGSPKHLYFGATTEAPVAGKTYPASTHVRVRNLSDPAGVQPQNVKLVDEVRITTASYNSATKSLTVAASSGGKLNSVGTATACSDPCLKVYGDGLPAEGVPLPVATTATTPNGRVVLANVTVPPESVTVKSSDPGINGLGGGGSAVRKVDYVGTGNVATVALQPDSAQTFIATPVTFDVLANDVGVAAVPNLALCTTPTACVASTATVPSTIRTTNGTVTLNGSLVVYTPNATYQGGTDTPFYYRVSTALGTTATAQVTVNVASLAQGPFAGNVTVSGVVGKTQLINVVPTAFAPGGIAMDTLRIVPLSNSPFNLTTNQQGPAGSAVFVDEAGTVPCRPTAASCQLRFTPPDVGAWMIVWDFKTLGGAQATPGRVTVNALPQEALTGVTAQFTAATARAGATLRVTGTSSVAANQRVYVFQNPALCPAGPANLAGTLSPAGIPVVAAAAPAAGGAFDGTLPIAAGTTFTLNQQFAVWEPTFGACTVGTVVRAR